jgi:hypothetical protein|tara:strand:+ start:693 stop:1313 length:621 start_codon:yes stop_codon:yes gene_type:complete
MALTKIDICNQALLKVGADMIASLDTSSSSTEAHIRSASLCNVFFDQALEESIRVYPFNSCKKRAIPVKLSDAPTFEYKFAFLLPNDCIRVIDVFDNDNAYNDRLKYVIEGKNILCDTEKIYIKYAAVPADITHLDSLAAQVVILKLALKLAYPMQLDDKIENSILKELEQVVLPYARSIDTFESSDYSQPESEMLLSRYEDTPRF